MPQRIRPAFRRGILDLRWEGFQYLVSDIGQRMSDTIRRRPGAERSQHKGALGAPEGGVVPSDGAHRDIIAHTRTLAHRND